MDVDVDAEEHVGSVVFMAQCPSQKGSSCEKPAYEKEGMYGPAVP